MERLLASQLSQGALLPQTTSGSDLTIYVPAEEVTPQVQPKPRGIQGNRSSIQLQETAIHHD